MINYRSSTQILFDWIPFKALINIFFSNKENASESSDVVELIFDWNLLSKSIRKIPSKMLLSSATIITQNDLITWNISLEITIAGIISRV